MKYETIISELNVNAHERRGLVAAIGHSVERPDWDTLEMFHDSYRQQFLGSQHVLSRLAEFSRGQLQLTDDSYARHVLGLLALEILCLSPRAALPPADLAKRLTAVLQQLRSIDEDWTRLPGPKREAYQVVLSAAWHDGVISPDEYSLLDRIRREFGLSQRAHWVLERSVRAAAEEGDRRGTIFPPRDLLNDQGKIETALIQGMLARQVRYDLVRAALVFPVEESLPDGRSKRDLWAMPDELADVLRGEAFDWELRPRTYERLLQTAAIGTQKVLMSIAEHFGLPKARTLEERREAIVESRVQPSELLRFVAELDAGLLTQATQELEAKTYKSPKRNIESILSTLAQIPDWKMAADPVATRLQRLVRHYEALACRDYPALRERNLIENDGDVDKAFEDTTHFLFATRLNLQTERAGRDAEDGRIRNSDGTLLLWDNKSCEGAKAHAVDLKSFANQFQGYIEKERKQSEVLAFMIIGPEFTKDVAGDAMNLEIQWGCEVVAVRAEDFLWLCERWRSERDSAALDTRFFASTGLLTKDVMKQRLSLRDWAV